MDLIACTACATYYRENSDALVAACASVGIEHGATTAAMIKLYLTGYHQDRHREPE